MSNLLFDERPLVVQPKLAEMLQDLDEAVILQQVHYWIQKNNNIRDGYSWVYNSMANWQKQFPWIAIATLKRKFKSLEDKDLLITANYNKAKFDKTKWYRINYSALDEIKQRLYQNDTTIVSECTNAKYQNDTTNTIDYTENNIIYKERGNTSENIFDLIQQTGIRFSALTRTQFIEDYVMKLKSEVIAEAAKFIDLNYEYKSANILFNKLDEYLNNGIDTKEKAIEYNKKHSFRPKAKNKKAPSNPEDDNNYRSSQLNW